MNATEFLELLLPDNGYVILAEPLEIPGQKTAPYRHHIFDSPAAAALKAAELNFEHKNVFFALAGYREPKVWNPSFKNRDGTLGKWQTRTQTNAGWLRSLFLDLDVDPAPDSLEKASKVFASKDEAAADLKAFCKKVGLPRPMVVDSGGGLHAYWPLSRDMEKAEWQVLADRLKNACLAEKLKIDPAVPSDAARVLRVLGCHNLKRSYAREVSLLVATTPVDPLAISTAIDTYEQNHGVLQPQSPARTYTVAVGSLGGNMERESSPVSFGNVMFACGVIGGQVACGGAGTTEPMWRATVGIAKFASDQQAALLAVSDQHANFNPLELATYVNKWQAGPTTCHYFQHKLLCGECASCPHVGKITSPVQLGNMVIEAATPTVTLVNAETGEEVDVKLPSPPEPYARYKGKDGRDCVGIASEDEDGIAKYKPVCPNDIYPVRILRQMVGGESTEKTMWKFHLARMDAVTLEVPQSLLSDTRLLHKFLLNAGVYCSSNEAEATKDYMSAYLKKLSNEVDREKVYHRLGWQYGGKNDAERQGFVLGDRNINMKGEVVACNVHQNVRNTLKNGIHNAGSREKWTAIVNKHYADPAYHAHRFFLYCSFAAPLFHISGQKSAVVAANGKSGRGKTTVLKVGSSIWGHPEALILNGNPDGSTMNAMYNHLGTLHSLPMMWDDTTERAGEELLRTALNISSGTGKQRLKGPDHDGKTVVWETLVLSSTNYDNVAQALAARKGTDANLMRLLGVSFEDLPPGSSKTDADEFLRGISENYGHVGLPFIQYVAKNYVAVVDRITARSKLLDTVMKVQSAERFWSWIVACAQVAAEIAQELELIDFPLQNDFDWMATHIQEVRENHQEFANDPVEQLADYLEANLRSTLVLSSKTTSNLGNIALRPQGSLTIRHELDKGLLFVNRQEISKFCAEHNISVKGWENQLITAGVLLDRSKLKTLGADTSFAKGQVRCWMIDTVRLGSRFTVAVQQATSNVQSLRPTGT